MIEFTRLEVPVPPQLEQAIGYEGSAHFVAFYWGGGDEAYWDDGRHSSTGDWSGYLAYVEHRALRPALERYNFGSSEEPARCRHFSISRWREMTSRRTTATVEMDWGCNGYIQRHRP